MVRRLAAYGLICSVVIVMAGCSRSVEIVAHRGASYLAPENTLSSVKLGWDKGADVEIDIHLTRDGRIVVIHDDSTKHITGVELKISETDAAELRKLDFGSFKGQQFAGEKIPYLSEVLETIPPGRKLYIEIKCGPEVLPTLRDELVASGKMSQIVIIGFDLDTVAASKEMIDVPTYWLRGTKKTKDTEQWIPHDPELVETARSMGLDGLDVHYAGVTREFVRAATVAGQKLYVWTVDDPDEARRLVELGVAGITTNRPQWLREQISR